MDLLKKNTWLENCSNQLGKIQSQIILPQIPVATFLLDWKDQGWQCLSSGAFCSWKIYKVIAYSTYMETLNLEKKYFSLTLSSPTSYLKADWFARYGDVHSTQEAVEGGLQVWGQSCLHVIFCLKCAPPFTKDDWLIFFFLWKIKNKVTHFFIILISFFHVFVPNVQNIFCILMNNNLVSMWTFKSRTI